MGFPEDMSLDDSDRRTGQSLFPEDERPTTNERLRRTERIIKDNPEYAMGRMMTEIVKLRQEVNQLNRGTNFGTGPFQLLRTSIRPQVQTAGISISAAAIVTTIWQILHQTGIIK